MATKKDDGIGRYDEGENTDKPRILSKREWTDVERLEVELERIAAIKDDKERWAAIHNYQAWLSGAVD